MKLIVRYCLILIFLCGISTGKGQEVFNKADSLFLVGDYHQAGLAYEWIIFSGPGPDQEIRAILGRVQSYKKLGLFDQAGSLLDQVNILEIPDSIKAAVVYETLLVSYLSGNYMEVQSRFLLGRPYIQNSGFGKQSKLLICLSHLKNGKWDQASISGESYIKSVSPPSQTDSLLDRFHIIFNPTNQPKLKDSRKARIFSMIIPGSGQIYSGYVKDGLISFGLHLLAVGGAGFAFSQGLYISGWIGGFGLLQKLYFGGIQRAEELSEQKNRLKKESFIQPASNFLIGLAEKYQ